MHKLVFASLAGSACLLACTGVFANDDTQRKIATADSFAALDRNGDKRLSRSEAGFNRMLSEAFADLDTDGDGFVSMAEFSAASDNNRITIGKLTRQ